MKKVSTKLLACIMCVALSLSLIFAFACAKAPTGVTISSAGNVTELEVGKTLQLTATVSPEGASQDVVWSSGDEAKATVSGEGLVTAKAAGNVMITAKSAENNDIKKDFALVIKEAAVDNTPTSITLTSAGGVSEIKVGETLKITAAVSPATASQSVTWSSGDETKATVSSDGTVTAKAVGNVMITAKSTEKADVKKDFALVIKAADPVVDNTPSSITLVTAGNATSVKVGETLKITATVSPAAAPQDVIWSSGDESVATVANGVVTGVKAGEAVITAKAKDVATVTKSVKITVTEDNDEPSTDFAALPFSTHAEYIAMENATAIKVKGIVTYIAANKDDKVSYYIQNGTDGFYIYEQNATKFPVQVGKVYEVGGAKTYYRTGVHEIKEIEYFKEINENITATAISLDDKNAGDMAATMPYQGAVVTGTATVTKAPETGTKAYSVNVKVNDKDTVLRIDAGNLASEVLTAINSKLANALAGITIEFKGVMTHYGNGNNKAPQILIYSADDITVNEATPAEKVSVVKDSLSVAGFVAAGTNTITLATTSQAFPDVNVSWASDNTAIIAADGTVTHPEVDTTVTLTATVTHSTEASATDTRQFKVNVAGSAFNGEKLLELNFEDAQEANNYGCSATKSSYTNKDSDGNKTDEANTVELGGSSWILNGALIGSAGGGDHADGTFAARVSAQNGKIETTVAGEYNYVEFSLATYNSQAHGTLVTVMYKMADGEEWISSEIMISSDAYTLTPCRIKLAEGAKNVRICVVSGTGNVNIDNIKLYK